MIRATAIALLCGLLGAQAQALEWDLNDYSFGVRYSTSTSYYRGVKDTEIFYPIPSSFGHSMLTDKPLFFRSGVFGWRKVQESGWRWGLIGLIQTQGVGSSDAPELEGVNRRRWTIEGGATVGRKIGPFETYLDVLTDVLGEHKGTEVGLHASLPWQKGRYFLIPDIFALHQSRKFVRYYFGVVEAEVAPGRPTYAPDSAITYGATLHAGWNFLDRWYLVGSAKFEAIPAEVHNSPLVDRNSAWSLTLGVSYRGASFLPPTEYPDDGRFPSYELNVGSFFAKADTGIRLDFGDELDLEDQPDLDDRKTVPVVDLIVRFNEHHRLEASYLGMDRETSVSVLAELSRTRFDTRTIKLGYGYSFFNDTQKELSAVAGMHLTDVSYETQAGSGTPASNDTTMLLPFVGLQFRTSLKHKLRIEAQAEIFRADFDEYSGAITWAGLKIEHQTTPNLSFGLGYLLYDVDIQSGDSSFFGKFDFSYHGPAIMVRVRN